MLALLRSTLATAVMLAVLAPTSARAQSTFTSFSDFIAAVGPYGVDTYDDLPSFEVVSGPLDRQAGSYEYSVAANGSGSSLFFPLENPDVGGDIWLSTEDADASMTFSGFGAEVRAVGGRFFATDLDGFVSGTDVTFIAEDINSNVFEGTWAPQSADAFFGVLFENPLLSLRIVAVNDPDLNDAFFATANDLVLAEGPTTVPVPEPSTLLLVAAPTVLLLARRRRRDA